MFYNDAKNEAIRKLKDAEEEYKKIAKDANKSALSLYQERKLAANAILRVQEYINSLANSPKEFQHSVEKVVLEIDDFRKAVKIEEENASNNIKGMGAAMGGIVTGGAIAAAGPTAAIAFATAFGTASTGAAISGLTGAAATNAALAWLGGGAIAAGGGGMAAGNAFLALAGPVGWGIAGALAVGGGLFATFKNKAAAEEAEKCRRKIKRKISVLRPKLTQLQELEKSTIQLKPALDLAPFNAFPKDYRKFDDSQKASLAALINNTKAMGKLINERIS